MAAQRGRPQEVTWSPGGVLGVAYLDAVLVQFPQAPRPAMFRQPGIHSPGLLSLSPSGHRALFAAVVPGSPVTGSARLQSWHGNTAWDIGVYMGQLQRQAGEQAAMLWLHMPLEALRLQGLSALSWHPGMPAESCLCSTDGC